jgi:hypothetical protein
MKPQLETGPQKWVVLGPTGLLRNALNAVAMAGRNPPHRSRQRSNHLLDQLGHTIYRIRISTELI